MVKTLVISTLRDEGPFLLDWLAHHRAAGVSDFLLFSNDCSDGTDILLDALQAQGIVTHVPQAIIPPHTPQWQALKSAWQHPLCRSADWIMGIDCDEYLNLAAPLANLDDLLATCGDKVDAITLPWRFFGHNGQVEFSDTPVSTQFTRAAPMLCPYPLIASYFKTLFRRQGPFRQLGVHRPKQKKSDRFPDARWLDGSGNRLDSGFARADQRISLYNHPAPKLVQLNHYSLRSAESFIVKRARGLPNHTDRQIDLNYWVERNFNSEEDLSIAHMQPAAAAEKIRLLSLPEIARCHAECVIHHRDAFAQAMQDVDTAKLYGRLLMAPDSQIVSTEQAHKLLAFYQKAQPTR